MSRPSDKHIQFVLAAILALLVSACALRPARAEDWPVVRGDILGTGVAKSAVPDHLDVIWT
jgi:hypothetical protein